jgi:hypothetical protein
MKVRDALGRFLEKYEWPCYGALFLAALLLRIAALQTPPLSEKEAAEAWGALHLLRGQSSSSASALFSSLTAGLLFLAGPSHWAPRILPAVAGASSVLLPLFLRKERGRLEPLLLAALLAFSPSLWIASTMAGGTMLGFLAAGFCIFYLRSGRTQPLERGVALGLAAASGPVGWSGLALAAIAVQAGWMRRMRNAPVAYESTSNPISAFIGRFFRTPAEMGGFAFGLIAGSTGLFFFPRGLGALAAGFSDWVSAFFSGWPRVGDFLLLLAAYEPLALVFGAAGIILVWRGLSAGEDRFWALFAAAAAVWVLFRPAAFPDEALWVILPLLALAARALRSALESTALEERTLLVCGQTAVALVLATFAFLNLAAYDRTHSWVYLLPILLGAAGIFIAGMLMAEKWSSFLREGLVGIGLACLLIFLFQEASAGWNAAYVRRNSANELWGSEIVAADVLRLHETLVQISEWQTGVADELAVVIEWPEESALGWELLTYGSTKYVTLEDMLSAPPMLITLYAEEGGEVVTPRLPAAYRGQVFAVAERRAWSGWPPDLLGWWLYRRGPVERGQMILWVRVDVLAPDQAEGE